MIPVLIAVAVALVFFAVLAYMIDQNAKQKAKEMPRLRACPICGKELAIGENILAERTGVIKNERERIFIKGCEYCLKKKNLS